MTDTDDPLAPLFPPASGEQWRALVDGVLKGADFERRLVSRSADGLAIQPLYGKAEVRPVLGASSGRRWRVCARVDHPDPDAASAQAREDLDGGVDALTLVPPGSRSARGFGLAIGTLNDLDRALDGVLIELIRLRLEPASGGRADAALVAALAARRKLDPAALDVEFGVDPIGALAWRGSLSASWETIAARLAEMVTTLTARGFAGPFIAVDARPAHEAGGSEAQELAFALAAAVAYLRALEAQGLSLEAARAALGFTVSVDADQFLSIAKLRALRRLFARVETACGLDPTPIRLNAETAWRMTARRDPWVNMLRATIAAFSAGIGGADSVTILPFTAALGLPDAFARRVARNTQHVLLDEADLWRVADPAAGSGAYEALTDGLCETAWRLFQEIEREGGLIESLAAGALQARIATAREARLRDVALRKSPIVGVSEYPNLAEAPVAVLDAAPPPAPSTRTRLQGPRLDFGGMIDALAGGVPRFSLAATPRDGLRCAPLPAIRLAEAFEALRDAADAITARTGARPAVFLAGLGPLTEFGARAAFARNLFEAGGLDAPVPEPVLDEDGATDLAALASAFRASGARLACLCGSDGAYAALAPQAASVLAAAGAVVWLAGRPGEREADWRAAGVSNFVYAGCDALAALHAAHERV